MASPEDHRQRAQRYLAMAETTPDQRIANGLRLLAAAYLDMDRKRAAQLQEQAAGEPDSARPKG
jgi:hypothetical protein